MNTIKDLIRISDTLAMAAAFAVALSWAVTL